MNLTETSKLGQVYAGSNVARKIAAMRPLGKPNWLKRYADGRPGHGPRSSCCWELLRTAMARSPSTPKAAQGIWRRLAGQLRRVIYWQEQVTQGRALRSRDLARYNRRYRELTKTLAGLGRQQFQWQTSWTETARTRAEREPPLDAETVGQELRVHGDLLRGVNGILRVGGINLAERVCLGARKTYGPDFDRLLPAILLSEHFREMDGQPHWQVVARMLSHVGPTDQTPEAIRKAVDRIPKAERREVYSRWEELTQGRSGRRRNGRP